MDKITRIGRQLKYAGSIVDFYQDDMQMPSGKIAAWDYIAHRKGAAAVLPVLPDGRILMVRQERPAIGEYTLEIPAGAKNDSAEPSIDCAARELEEETGYRTDQLELLVKIATTPAFCNEYLEIYLARDLVKTEQHLDEDEFLNVEVWKVEDLVKGIEQFEIVDSKTVAAILTYYSKYVREDLK